MEEARPLEALDNVEINDVDAVLAVEGLEDGLVSSAWLAVKWENLIKGEIEL